MKKILAFIFAAALISSAAFSKNFFSQRYFEIKTGTSVDFSNNLFAFNDIMKKDLVIDLKKLADECPENGFNIRSDAEPRVEINLNIKDFHLGFASGVEMYENLEIGKDVFDFLGHGNTIGDTMEFTFTNDADVFAFSQIDVGFKVGKIKINARPAVFRPILSIRGGGGSMEVLNDSDGNLNVAMNLKLNVYSATELKSKGNRIEFDEKKITTALQSGYGFDMGGGISYPFTDSFSVDASCRIPVLPGYLDHKVEIEGGFDYKVKLSEFKNSDKTDRETVVTNTKETISLHRPLKFNVYVDKNLAGNLFNARAGGGFGIRRPYSDLAVVYPEYYFGFTLNLIDVFKLGISTQYKDQVFIHQIGTTINVRIIQLDIGVSTQATNIMKSLAVGGMGAYAYVTMGF